jgi:hypothetical protein
MNKFMNITISIRGSHNLDCIKILMNYFLLALTNEVLYSTTKKKVYPLLVKNENYWQLKLNKKYLNAKKPLQKKRALKRI